MPQQRLCGTLPRQVSHEAERLGELVDAINALLGTEALRPVPIEYHRLASIALYSQARTSPGIVTRSMHR